MTTRKIVGMIEGMEITLSVVIIDDGIKEMAFVLDGKEVRDNLVFRYRSSEGGKQIALHVMHLLSKCSTVEEWEDIIWSDEWTSRWIMWSNM